MKKAIRWPAKFYKAERGKYAMIAEAGGRPVTASLARLFHDRWAFNVAEGPAGEMSFLRGYAHTMAAAKRCAHRDMVFLLERAGVKGAF